jgi:hypothetical protein
LLERLGFTREGTQRAHSLEDDAMFHDSAIYGMLAHEFDVPWSTGPRARGTVDRPTAGGDDRTRTDDPLLAEQPSVSAVLEAIFAHTSDERRPEVIV